MPKAMRDDAWDAVVALEREAGQRLYGYALRLGIDSGRAADLVQDALLRLWRELGQGTVIGSREAWTYRALSRLAMDEHRLHRRIAGLVSRLGDRVTPRVMEIDSDRAGGRLVAGRPAAAPPAPGGLPALPGRPVVR